MNYRSVIESTLFSVFGDSILAVRMDAISPSYEINFNSPYIPRLRVEYLDVVLAVDHGDKQMFINVSKHLKRHETLTAQALSRRRT